MDLVWVFQAAPLLGLLRMLENVSPDRANMN